MLHEAARKPSALGQKTGAAVLALLMGAIYSLYSWFQWRHYVIPSWDLGIFSQLAQNYATLQFPPIVHIKGDGFNLWGDHFHPILLILGPIYAIFPHPSTLLYVQNALIALSIFLVARFAQKIIGNLWGLLLALAYALSFGIQQAVAVQFHEVAFALPFLALSLGHLVLSRTEQNPDFHLMRAALWILPLAFVKEDLGFTVAVVGALAVWRSGWLSVASAILFPSLSGAVPGWGMRIRSLARSLSSRPAVLAGFGTAGAGLSISLLAVWWILPAFNTAGTFDYGDRLDIAGALADPLQSLGLMFYPWEKTASWGLLLLAGVLLWVASPLALVALPTLAWRFLSTQEGYWESTWHYSLVLMPVIFLALLDVLARARVAESAPSMFGSLQLKRNMVYAAEAYRAHAHRVIPVLAVVVAFALLAQQPLKDLANPAFATTVQSESDRTKASAVAAIPDGAVVASDLSILTYLVPNHDVYWIGHAGEPAPEYVVIDLAGTSWGSNPPADPVQYAADRYHRTYTLEQELGSIKIIRRLDNQ